MFLNIYIDILRILFQVHNFRNMKNAKVNLYKSFKFLILNNVKYIHSENSKYYYVVKYKNANGISFHLESRAPTFLLKKICIIWFVLRKTLVFDSKNFH